MIFSKLEVKRRFFGCLFCVEVVLVSDYPSTFLGLVAEMKKLL